MRANYDNMSTECVCWCLLAPTHPRSSAANSQQRTQLQCTDHTAWCAVPNLAPPCRSLLGPHFHNRARISEEVMNKLMELPGTRGLGELRARAEDLTTWKIALQRGCVFGV